MTCRVLDFEVEKARRIVAHEREQAEARERQDAARAVAADEATAGAEMVAGWSNALTRYVDPTVAALMWAAEFLDELLEADDLDAMRVACLQIANGARMAALMRARRARR